MIGNECNTYKVMAEEFSHISKMLLIQMDLKDQTKMNEIDKMFKELIKNIVK